MRFDQPVGTVADRNASKVWAGGWDTIIDYGQYYTVPTTGAGAYHPGVDLNHPKGDTGKPVFAAANGVVTRILPDRWVSIIIVEHNVDNVKMWTRYAHGDPKTIQVPVGRFVNRGDWLVNIGDYYPAGTANDHLHYDIAKIDLTSDPANWPGANRAAVLANYVDPYTWTNNHREDGMGSVARVPYGRSTELYDVAWAKANPELYLRLCWLALNSDNHNVGASGDDAYLRVLDKTDAEGQRWVRHWGMTAALYSAYQDFENTYYHSAAKPTVRVDGDENTLPAIPQSIVDKLSTGRPAGATVEFGVDPKASARADE